MLLTATLDQPQPTQILVVDDEQAQVETIRRGLFLYGYQTLGAHDARQAMQLLQEVGADILVTDLTMPGSSGFDLVRQVRARDPDFPVVVITGLVISREVDELRRQGITVVQKPFSPDQLDAVIRRLSRRRAT